MSMGDDDSRVGNVLHTPASPSPQWRLQTAATVLSCLNPFVYFSALILWNLLALPTIAGVDGP